MKRILIRSNFEKKRYYTIYDVNGENCFTVRLKYNKQVKEWVLKPRVLEFFPVDELEAIVKELKRLNSYGKK